MRSDDWWCGENGEGKEEKKVVEGAVYNEKGRKGTKR